MRIQVTAVSGVTSKPGKFKPYQVYDLEFIDQSDGRAKKRQMIDFNSGAAFQKLLDAGIGSTWEVSTKPAKDPKYTDWVDATPAEAEAQDEAPKAAGKTSAPAFKSTYETPEERARKQVYIVRQSSITNAVATLALNPTHAASKEAVVEMAKFYEAYVFGSQVVEPEVPTVD
jgi:hypothetical protein